MPDRPNFHEKMIKQSYKKQIAITIGGETYIIDARDVHFDVVSDITLLCQTILQINTQNGFSAPSMADWKGGDVIPRALCLVHSEVSEALEAYRHDDYEEFKKELADIVIRVFHICAGLNINIDHEINAKIKINKTRPFKHGGKKV